MPTVRSLVSASFCSDAVVSAPAADGQKFDYTTPFAWRMNSAYLNGAP